MIPCVHVVTSIEEEASGPTYSVTRLAEAQARLGQRVSIYSLVDNGYSETSVNGVVYRRFKRSGSRKLGFSNTMLSALRASIERGTVVHTHGLWRMPNVYSGWAAREKGGALLLSPRGMLGDAALKFSNIQKKIFWEFLQKQGLRSLRCLHATAMSEVEDIRQFGLKTSVAVLPNGIDVLKLESQPLAIKDVKTVLHLGRLHPKKGIENLVHAWHQLDDLTRGWELKIIGPSEMGYREQLERLTIQLGVLRIRFEDPVYGDRKVQEYMSADVFVLPTLHENFGLVVAESLAAAVPVITTRGAPWEGLQTNGCGWWIDHGIDPLVQALRECMELDEASRKAMGQRGRAWMERDFAWDSIASDMYALHEWCLGSNEKPGFVVD